MYVRPEHVQRLEPTWQLIRLLSNVMAGSKITVITRKLIMTSAWREGGRGRITAFDTALLPRNFTVKRALRVQRRTVVARKYSGYVARPNLWYRSITADAFELFAAGNSAVTIMACILSRSVRRLYFPTGGDAWPFMRKYYFRGFQRCELTSDTSI